MVIGVDSLLQNETELQFVQRVRTVSAVKEIKRGTFTSRRSTLWVLWVLWVQDILLYFYPHCLACLSTDFNATLGSIGNWLGIYIYITAFEEHKDFLACVAQSIWLNSRNKSSSSGYLNLWRHPTLLLWKVRLRSGHIWWSFETSIVRKKYIFLTMNFLRIPNTSLVSFYDC